MVILPLGPYQELAIIATAAGVLVIALLVIVCLVSPYCWCHTHCPCAPRYPGEGVADSSYKKISRSKSITRLLELQPLPLPTYKEPAYKIISETEKQTEKSPLALGTVSEVALGRRYDSVSADTPIPDYRRYYSRKPVKSLEISLRWNHADGTAAVHLKTLHLTRVKRRRGVVVRVELISDRRPFLVRAVRIGRGQEKVAEHQTEIREQNAQVTLDEIFTINWTAIRGKGTLRFVVHATEGATLTDAVGKAELPLEELDPTQQCAIRLYLTPPQQVSKGECRISLCYLPTAEKLSVTVDECHNMRINVDDEHQEHEVYVQMSLLFKNRALGKKKTSFRKTRGPVLPQRAVAIKQTFDLPPDRLNVVCLMLNFKRLSRDSDSDKGSYSTDNTSEIFTDDDVESLPSRDITIGSVIIGLESGLPAAQAHWNEMIATPRLPVVRWHHVL